MSFEQVYKDTITFLEQHISPDSHPRKPLLPHLLRVGRHLYQAGYPKHVVEAGLLHDALEWLPVSEQILKERFGNEVLLLVNAATKDSNISDPVLRREYYVRRCAELGMEALVVKAADILDSYQYYAAQGNESELERCRHIAELLLGYTSDMQENIFQDLKRITAKKSSS